MTKSTQKLIAFVFGVVFIVVLLVLAVLFPNPTPFQYTVFRIVLALAAGGVAAMIPGFLAANVSTFIRAGGALAVFVVVYFYSPAALTGVQVRTEQELEIEKPIVNDIPSRDLPSFFSAALAGDSETVDELVVLNADDLARPGVLLKRYRKVTFDRVHARMPAGATLVANEVDGIRGGAITGDDFSIVARQMSNMIVDVSGAHEPDKAGGSVWLYVKLVQNSRLLATGLPGKAGVDGNPGPRGPDGGDGRNGQCGPGMLGQFQGSQGGANGGNGINGSEGTRGGDGSAGGFIALMAITHPVATTINVAGGPRGPGGKGGRGGLGGKGGKGGAGCMGIGGSQPTRPNGKDGDPGSDGRDGPNGNPGMDGEYRPRLVKTFDKVVAALATTSNDKLGSVLRSL